MRRAANAPSTATAAAAAVQKTFFVCSAVQSALRSAIAAAFRAQRCVSLEARRSRSGPHVSEAMNGMTIRLATKKSDAEAS